MKALEEKILTDGTLIGSELVKVDNFINHQIDVRFMEEIGKEIGRLYGSEQIDKVLTVEASGIVIAYEAAKNLGYPPVVFAKKKVPGTLTGEFFKADAMSFTKGTVSTIVVSSEFLKKGENVLIVDDFLARGEASMALASIVEQAGGKVVGVCAAIEKEFQGGSELLRKKGYRVDSLAVIAEMCDGKVTFR